MDLKFSIITCTYNSEDYLLKNIQSVQKQSYANFEHVFIDGFSQDSTLDLIAEYQREFPTRVKLFQVEPKGISHAMNEGIKRSTGEYLIHLHSDDSLFDTMVLSDIDQFLSSQQSGLDWIYGKIQVVEASGRSVGIFPTRKIWHKITQDQFFKSYLLKFFNYIPHQAVFMHREVFKRFGYFDETLKSAMDPDLWLRIKDKTNWLFFDRVISNYCVRSGSQSASAKNISSNKKNFCTVQNRYLRLWERPIAFVFNYYVNKRNKNIR